MARAQVSKVYINDFAIITACNRKGGTGGVYDWLESGGRLARIEAKRMSPKSDIRDRLHRPGDRGGTYRRSWSLYAPVGSNQHQLRRILSNLAPYANYVERGRGDVRYSYMRLIYSSKNQPYPRRHKSAPWFPGKHILKEVIRDWWRGSFKGGGFKSTYSFRPGAGKRLR